MTSPGSSRRGPRAETEKVRTRFLSEKTVRNHVSACLHNLPVAVRAEAVALARTPGSGRAPDRCERGITDLP
jgi:hypothetical protein